MPPARGNRIYDPTTVIECFMPAEFDKIDPICLIEAAGPFSDTGPEQKMLETWRQHYINLKVPFSVAKRFVGPNRPRSYIWKERRAVEGPGF